MGQLGTALRLGPVGSDDVEKGGGAASYRESLGDRTLGGGGGGRFEGTYGGGGGGDGGGGGGGSLFPSAFAKSIMSGVGTVASFATGLAASANTAFAAATAGAAEVGRCKLNAVDP
jgi:hypothetical protein